MILEEALDAHVNYVMQLKEVEWTEQRHKRIWRKQQPIVQIVLSYLSIEIDGLPKLIQPKNIRQELGLVIALGRRVSWQPVIAYRHIHNYRQKYVLVVPKVLHEFFGN